jgi:hypothetical protein
VSRTNQFVSSNSSWSSCASRPIDVDTLLEYEEEEDEEEDEGKDHSPEEADDDGEYPSPNYRLLLKNENTNEDAKRQNTKSGDKKESPCYYEGESLFEYSTDEDDTSSSIDFDTGFFALTKEVSPRASPKVHKSTVVAVSPDERTFKGRDNIAAVAGTTAVTTTGTQSASSRSVNVMGPICLDTSYLLKAVSDNDEEKEILDETSETYIIGFSTYCGFDDDDFPDEFPILDERDMDRELVGYMPGFEPIVEDLPPLPRPKLSRSSTNVSSRSRTSTRSGGARTATTSRSNQTRITFEI